MMKIYKKTFFITEEEAKNPLVQMTYNQGIPKDIAEDFMKMSPKYGKILGNLLIDLFEKYWAYKVDFDTGEIKNPAWFTKWAKKKYEGNQEEAKKAIESILKFLKRGNFYGLSSKDKAVVTERLKTLYYRGKYSKTRISDDGEEEDIKVSLPQDFKVIAEWMNNQTQNPDPSVKGLNINYRNLDIDKARGFAYRWKRFKEGKEFPIEKGKLLKKYNDGYYWVDLGPGKHPKEGLTMSHCGHGSVEEPEENFISHLLSLRTEQHKPVITIDWDANDGTVYQIVGIANSTPKPQYHKYIVDFLRDKDRVKRLKLTQDIRSKGRNLQLNQLDIDTYEQLKQERPELFDSSGTILREAKEERVMAIKRYRRKFKNTIKEETLVSGDFSANLNAEENPVPEHPVEEEQAKRKKKKGKCGGTPVGSQRGAQDGTGPGKLKKKRQESAEKGYKLSVYKPQYARDNENEPVDTKTKKKYKNKGFPAKGDGKKVQKEIDKNQSKRKPNRAPKVVNEPIVKEKGAKKDN